MSGINFLNMLLALGVVIGMMLLLAYGLKFIQSKVQSNVYLELAASIPLDGKRRACVLKAGTREFLLIMGTQNEHVIELSPVQKSQRANGANEEGAQELMVQNYAEVISIAKKTV
jgi:flagellar biogenesis protein FliO